ncbi:MAG: site-specific DNA-methyltransferase [Planctomycetaceae bacterium]|nr:site-specific DNA-methyltransferase [Planctomycetaceae bacterium]
MRSLPDGSIDLAFADPPFNIGYKYDVYDDRKSVDEYLGWSEEWIKEVYRLLKEDGAFWLAIGDDFAAELKILAQNCGFHTRNWVIWYYTFGVHCKSKFTRSHTHLLYFVKDPRKFTFNRDAIAVPSARQLVYNDNRANPKGRVPDDTWILRPQDCQDGFNPDENCWYFPRVAGTFKERAGFHGCQMPEQLLGRIIRCCSRAGEIVFDPFSGSASTSVVAKKLHRNYLSMELSQEYASKGQERIDAVQPGDPLNGADDPRLSAPVTFPTDGRGRQLTRSTGKSITDREIKATFEDDLISAFAETHAGYSVDRLVLDPLLNQAFLDTCSRKGLEGEPLDLNRYLFRLRKSGKLKSAGIETEKRTSYSWEKLDQFLDAAEIAWKKTVDEHQVSLDDLFCDPLMAAEFDRAAAQYAPGFSSIDYRWAALTVRKQSRVARSRAEKLARERNSTKLQTGKTTRLAEIDLDNFENRPGLYVIKNENTQLYIGETLDLRRRLKRCFVGNSGGQKAWRQHGDSLSIAFPEITLKAKTNSHIANELLGYQSFMIAEYTPILNALNQVAS